MELKQEQQLFVDSAWLLYCNSKRILGDLRMAYTPINMPNGLMYCGDKAFKGATIGVYLDWWQECEKAVVTDEDGRRHLIVCFGGSVLSGWNKCNMVDEDGNVSEIRVQNFHSMCRHFIHLCHRYANGDKPEQPLSLKEVISQLT